MVDKEDSHMSVEEEDTVRQFKEGLKFDGEHYEVPLPWKRDAPELKSNYYQAVKRLESTEKLLKQNSEKAEAYKNAINQYVEKGYAVEIKDDDHNRKVWYLPHSAIFRKDSKPTKCRFVFDASAHGQDGVSLNDCIQLGPALQPDLYPCCFIFEHTRLHLWLT